jgi:2,4-dienoyl-CoA reductase-like NADH-dependent reductase (Old Yellow Enzyme family)
MATTVLFSPFSLRNLELPNRIVVSPMGQYSGDEHGRATDWHLMHLGHLAISGAGLLFTEATAVEREGRISKHDIGMWSDDQIEPLRRVIDFCRQHSRIKLGMQLYHAGRKGSVTVAWEGLKPIPQAAGGWTIWSASASAHPGRAVPVALDHAGIKRVIAAFAAAARRADAIGFDVLEIHGAHGYLIHSFLSPFGNQRTDEYGGDRAGRMHFALEVFDAVRAVWPERKPLGMRLSATDWAEGGWTLDDSVELAAKLRERGCDYITASSGGVTSEQKLQVHPGYQVPFADRIRRESGIATMAVGLITEPSQAEEILASGKADLVALARGMLFNPRWPWLAAVELGGQVFYPRQYERAHPSMRGGDFLNPVREKQDDTSKTTAT